MVGLRYPVIDFGATQCELCAIERERATAAITVGDHYIFCNPGCRRLP